MTREEAIKVIEYLPVPITKRYSFEQIRQAYKMAIDALSQPIVCKDYCIDDDHIYCSPKMADMVYEALQAKPKTGKWIIKHGNYCGVLIKEFYCDQCGERGGLSRMLYDPEPLPNYCSNCGSYNGDSNNETHKEETR